MGETNGCFAALQPNSIVGDAKLPAVARSQQKEVGRDLLLERSDGLGCRQVMLKKVKGDKIKQQR